MQTGVGADILRMNFICDRFRRLVGMMRSPGVQPQDERAGAVSVVQPVQRLRDQKIDFMHRISVVQIAAGVAVEEIFPAQINQSVRMGERRFQMLSPFLTEHGVLIAVFLQIRPIFRRQIGIAVSAGKEAVKAETAVGISGMILAEVAEIKAVLAERLADQPCALFRLRVIIELSVLVRIEPREHTGARRHTERMYGFAVREADALAAQMLIGIQHRACAKRIFIMMKRNVVHGQPQNISISCSHKALLPARHC